MTLLVVLGMHRSGTSALTGVLSLLGFNAGLRLLPANESNTRGYFESSPLNSRLDALLGAMNRSWSDERTLPTDWLDSDAAKAAKVDLAHLFQQEFDLSRPMVIKNPRICRLLPLMQSTWHSLGLDVKYVIPLRSPHAVIRSLGRRDAMAPPRAALLYVAHLIEAEYFTRGQPRLFVEYDHLLRDWREVVLLIQQRLQIDGKFLSDNIRDHGEAIDHFLSVDLNHFDSLERMVDAPAVVLASELFELLRSNLDCDRVADLDNLRGRWAAYLDSLEPWIDDSMRLDRFRSQLPAALFNPGDALLAEASRDATSDVYYSTGMGYDESMKVSNQWAYGQRMHQRFTLPPIDGVFKSLRLDIADRPVSCLIEAVWVEDPSGAPVWEWSPDRDLFGGELHDMHVLGLDVQRQLKVMATGFDPHATLQIPPEVLQAMGRDWALCCSWQAKIPVSDLKSLIVEVEQARDALGRSATEAIRKARQERSSVRLRAEVFRAEVQLSLLKELLCSSTAKEDIER
jgi:hypothetical protein